MNYNYNKETSIFLDTFKNNLNLIESYFFENWSKRILEDKKSNEYKIQKPEEKQMKNENIKNEIKEMDEMDEKAGKFIHENIEKYIMCLNGYNLEEIYELEKIVEISINKIHEVSGHKFIDIEENILVGVDEVELLDFDNWDYEINFIIKNCSEIEVKDLFLPNITKHNISLVIPYGMFHPCSRTPMIERYLLREAWVNYGI